jgi:hypothetical protein
MHEKACLRRRAITPQQSGDNTQKQSICRTWRTEWNGLTLQRSQQTTINALSAQ